MDQNSSTPSSNEQPEPPVASAPQPSQPSQPAGSGKSNKALVITVVVAMVVIALLVAVIAFMMTNQSNKTDGSQSPNNSSDNNTGNSTDQNSANTSKKIVATQETSKSGLFVDVYEPVRAGNTLVVNYKVYNKDTEKDLWASAIDTGIYQTSYKSIPEPYAIADSDSQKYGLIRDDNDEPLATKTANAWLSKGESINGYVTLTLPPNNTKVAISLGSMSLITGVEIKY